MKKKMLMILPLILFESLCCNVVFSQCGGTGYGIGQNGSKLLVYDCNNTFLCHMFVRMYYESNCDMPSYNRDPIMGTICSWNSSNYEYPNSSYWDLSTYVTVAEGYANIVYLSGNGQQHSAVKDRLCPDKYISKYDMSGPVVGHPYKTSNYEVSFPSVNFAYSYYFYLGKITGTPQISNSTPVNFSVNSSAGVGYTWSVSPAGIVSLANTGSSTVTVTPVQNGNTTLTLTANGKSQSIGLTVNIPPPPPLFTGSYDNAGIYNRNLLTVNDVSVGGVFIRVSYPGATTYTWQKTSGNINAYLSPGPTASFNMTSGGTITILISAKSGSTTLATKSVTFY